jgi:hypothetical protein
MSLAQKKARENFKKAIAYRKKTGCSLKQAFAYVKGGKVTGVKKSFAKKKAVKKVVRKKTAKKKAVSSHKDTRSHNVNIRVVSGVLKGKEKSLTMWKDIYGKLSAQYVSLKDMKQKRKIAKDLKQAREVIQKLK